ncbi:MAG TPA: uroporphyrinogen decarboxylase, partial [Gemmatimonadales bacterium]|nr:uroporphyrinogen decarboxylase [Gemmatimonadales bacterium]
MAVAIPAETARFLRAARGGPVDATPVWFMRQAGRYLPEYRAIRARLSLLEICARPEVAAEVTLQPVQRLGVDAAILFADILLPLVPLGLRLEFAQGEGPVIHNPIRDAAAVDALRDVAVPEALAPVFETIRLVRRGLPEGVPLIGFAGAPFTLASYAIEGGSSRHFVETKRLMYHDPATWHRLLARLGDLVADYLTEQVRAGAQALQLFDSWVGALDPEDYRRAVLPHSRALFQRLRSLGVPVVHFGVGTGSLLELLAEAGGDVIGVDWRTPLADAWRRLGSDARL